MVEKQGTIKKESGQDNTKSRKFEIVYFLIILVTAFAVYMLPVNELPFGDVDSSTHFGLGDNIGQNKDFGMNLPYYLNFTYGFANDGQMWYHPLLPYMIGISQIVSGSRIWAPFILFALLSSLFIPFTVLLIKRLFGFWPSLISIPILLFSVRDFTTYSWGLWPERISYSLIPIILLLTYSYLKNKNLWTSFIVGALLGIQGAFHIQGVMITIPIIIFYSGYLWIKNRKCPFNYKHILNVFIIFFLILLPSLTGLLNYNESMGNTDTFKIQELESLLHWYPENIPYAPQLADIQAMYFGIPYYIFIIFVAMFVIVGLFQSDKKDGTMLFLIWLFVIYLLMHLNVIGFPSRIHRFINAEGMILLSIFAIAIYFLFNNILAKLHFHKKATYVVIFLLLSVLLSVQYVPKFINTYEGIARVNQYEVDACEWVRYNLPEEAHMRIVGTPIYYERKWIQVLCQRHSIFDDQTLDGSQSEFWNMSTHIYFDKSIELYSGSRMSINSTFLKRLYANNYVEVYEYDIPR